MGDRGNIIVKDGNSKVFLYSHWTGSDLPKVVKKALGRKERWDDGQYLARILFCEMVKGHEGEATGFGISSEIGDGGTDILVDCDNQTVQEGEDEKPIAFKDYI
jgi:hypothetical protein